MAQEVNRGYSTTHNKLPMDILEQFTKMVSPSKYLIDVHLYVCTCLTELFAYT
jgi:hypothetical protein